MEPSVKKTTATLPAKKESVEKLKFNLNAKKGTPKHANFLQETTLANRKKNVLMLTMNRGN